ncbi:hypothetical protein AVEN_230814-1 [Araneus ventricosus]|uniref:Uncharacterized protein n=1 Tax=Araneus ventricosus TaxID=182803 RepID=A0A4Y2A3B5_ARAVE|nr:hypothetical protein AVEN_230814-1 [Araneus ventricosus]
MTITEGPAGNIRHVSGIWTSSGRVAGAPSGLKHLSIFNWARGNQDVPGIWTSSGRVAGAPSGVKHLPVYRWLLVILLWVNGYLKVATRHPQVGYARVTSSKALTRNHKGRFKSPIGLTGRPTIHTLNRRNRLCHG